MSVPRYVIGLELHYGSISVRTVLRFYSCTRSRISIFFNEGLVSPINLSHRHPKEDLVWISNLFRIVVPPPSQCRSLHDTCLNVYKLFDIIIEGNDRRLKKSSEAM